MNRTIEIQANMVNPSVLMIRVYENGIVKETIAATEVHGVGELLSITPANTAIVYL